MKIRRPRSVFAQVLLAQLAITTGVAVIATGLFLAPLSEQLDDQAMYRALAIAQTTAVEPDTARNLLATGPEEDGPVQRSAERIRRTTGALYVVVLDRRGIRWSHPDPRRIGERVSTDPGAALSGEEVRQIDSGTLGRSARAKVPLRDDGGRIVGAVSVGIAYDSVRERLVGAVPGLLLYAGVALGLGALASFLASRGVRRGTRGLGYSDISALLAEREAMLHGIREGVVAIDADNRIRLVNDEARRLLDLDAEVTGRPLGEVLPPGRTGDVLAGRIGGTDLLTVSGGRVLVTNRMPTDDGGAVTTLRDRTELELLGRELDSTQGLLDALRAQDHEHANRLHTLLGLSELGLHEEAGQFLAELTDTRRTFVDEIAGRVREPLLAALLVGKSAVAAERGVALRVSPATSLPQRVVDPRDLATVLGNLVDNALDAAGGAGGRDPAVEVRLTAEGTTAVLRVSDTGAGVPAAMRERVFEEGWSTKPAPAHRSRGLGLGLVRRLATRYGGAASVAERPGGGAVFTVVLPEALVGETMTYGLHRDVRRPRGKGAEDVAKTAAAEDGAEDAAEGRADDEEDR